MSDVSICYNQSERILTISAPNDYALVLQISGQHIVVQIADGITFISNIDDPGSEITFQRLSAPETGTVEVAQ